MNTTNEFDVNQSVRYLNAAFARATQGLGKAVRIKDKDKNKYVTTRLYDAQVDFCYMVNEITRGPKYFVPKLIADCNKMIEQLQSEPRLVHTMMSSSAQS